MVIFGQKLEAIARVERQGSEEHIQIIKTISLIEFLGKPFDIRASESLFSDVFQNLTYLNTQRSQHGHR